MDNTRDIRIDTFIQSNSYPLVRVTHRPTGLIVECQESISEPKNREKALEMLEKRIRAGL